MNAGMFGHPSGPNSELWLQTTNGFASVAVAAVRFSTVSLQRGNDFTYQDSPEQGALITIGTPGLYTVSLQAVASVASGAAVVRNLPPELLGTALTALSQDRLLAYGVVAAASYPSLIPVTTYLYAGDTIRFLQEAVGGIAARGGARIIKH